MQYTIPQNVSSQVQSAVQTSLFICTSRGRRFGAWACWACLHFFQHWNLKPLPQNGTEEGLFSRTHMTVWSHQSGTFVSSSLWLAGVWWVILKVTNDLSCHGCIFASPLFCPITFKWCPVSTLFRQWQKWHLSSRMCVKCKCNLLFNLFQTRITILTQKTLFTTDRALVLCMLTHWQAHLEWSHC